MKRTIIIIGGYNSLWPIYLKMARHLEDVAGLRAVGVPLMPWHWWSTRQAENASNILQKLEETVLWARRRLRSDRFILVGHSAGGVIARLYLHDGPVWGKVYAGLEHITTLVTLGSPHCGEKGAETDWFLTDEANRLVPGNPFSEHVRSVAVAGKFLQGRKHGNYRERRAFQTYQFFTGQGNVWGDGVVPVESASLDGAERIVLEGVAHSRKHGAQWYGASKAIIRRWWPAGASDAT